MAAVPPLESSVFEAAISSYVERTKPDPLIRKQIEAWKVEWCNDEKKVDHHSTIGQLKIHGEHISIVLSVNCQWSWNTNKKCGSLDFELKANAQFRGKGNSKFDKKMKKRLQQDDYIAKLLITRGKDEEQNDTTLLCEATIVLGGALELEERCWINQDVLEGIRRSIFSCSTTPLELMELIVNLPYLQTLHQACPLGHRAKMRILEDATVDACDQAGEDDLIEACNLQESNCNDDEEQETRQKQKKGRTK